MALSAAEVLLVVKAKDEATGIMQKVKGEAQALGSSMGTALKAGGLAAAGGIAAAGYALVGFVKDAAAEQVGIAQLTTAIATLDEAHKGSASAVETVVRAREKLAFADDDLRASLATLIPATGDYEEAVRRQKIAMDVARGTGLDLATTSRLIGKVTEESTNVFKRYGINIKAGATEQEALAAVQAKFAGQSEAYAQTAAGKWAIFNNQLDNIKESIGGALLPVVTQLGTQLGEFLTRHQDDIERFSAALGEKIPAAIDGIVDAFNAARPTLEVIFENVKAGFETIRPGLEWILNNKVALTAALIAIGVAGVLAFTPITLPILAVVAALGVLLFTIGIVRRNWDEIKATTLEVWNSIVDFMNSKLGFLVLIATYYFETIKNQVQTAILIVRDIITIVMALIHGDWSAAWEGLKKLLGDVWDGIVADITLKVGLVRDIVFFGFEVAKNLAVAAFETLKTTIAGIWDDIETKIGDVIDGILGKIEGLKGPVNKAIDVYNAIPGVPDLPHFAGGVRNFAGGLAVVGERGPELVQLPPGANVYSSRETRQMAAAVSGQGAAMPPVQNFYIDRLEIHGDPAAGLAALGMSI